VKLLAGLALALALAVPGAASAQEPSSGTTTTTLEGMPSQDIIPKPGEGEAPEEAGDRGGALQLAVLALVVGSIALAVTVVVRQSRRARAGRGSL
jgi:hypothetical protein